MPNYCSLLRGVMEIWKQLLQKTEELGKRHGDIGDLFMSSISETMKTLRRQKEQLYKQHIDVAHRMVNEVLESVRELTLVRACMGTSPLVTVHASMPVAMATVKTEHDSFHTCMYSAVSHVCMYLYLSKYNTHCHVLIHMYIDLPLVNFP